MQYAVEAGIWVAICYGVPAIVRWVVMLVLGMFAMRGADSADRVKIIQAVAKMR